MSEARAAVGEADLHAHSTVSDGTEAPAVVMAQAAAAAPPRGRVGAAGGPPAVVMAQAAAAGLWGVALTDHDSTSGWAEAAAAVPETGVTLIPGMELSTRDGFTSVHMLAYL